MTDFLKFLDAHDTPYDPDVHAENDLFLLGLHYVERELGETENIIRSRFVATVQNLGIEYLNSIPSRYASWSYRDEGDAVAIEKARGRLITLPTELVGDTCELEFECVPPDEDEVLKAAADALRTGEVDYDPDADEEDREAAEIYDPLFFSPEAADDPGNALAGTMDQWRWNPRTLVPERVNLITGTIQHVIAGPTSGVYKSERLSILNPPKKNSRIRLIAQWTQSASGDQSSEFMSSETVTSYSYKSILDGMPKSGDAIGSSTGWTIADAKIIDAVLMPPVTFGRLTDSLWGTTAQQIEMQPMSITIGMRAHYEYQQSREEIIDIYMSAGVQPVLDEDKVETVDQINLSSLTLDVTTAEWVYEDPDTLEIQHYEVGDRRQANGRVFNCLVEHDATESFTPWLYDAETGEPSTQLWEVTVKSAAIDAKSPRLVGTDRGVRVIRHALRRLHRIVQRRARAAEVSFEVPWSVGRAINCKHECLVENRRFPGGELTGKVIGVELKIDGAKRSAIITLGVSVGKGIMPDEPEGDESQTGDIVYSVTAPATNIPVDAYGLNGQAPRVLVYENQEPDQQSIGFAAAAGGGDPVKAIAENPTKIRVYFEPMREEDLITRRISVHTNPIFVRKGIDLSPEI